MILHCGLVHLGSIQTIHAANLRTSAILVFQRVANTLGVLYIEPLHNKKSNHFCYPQIRAEKPFYTSMLKKHRQHQAHSFLRGLWPDDIDAGKLVVWTLSQDKFRKSSYWCNSIAEAADAAARFCTIDHVYFGVALQDQQQALTIRRKTKPNISLSNVRGTKDSTVAIPALWADIDIAGDAHASRDRPPSQKEALGLLEAIPLTPSLIVNSGYGLHCYWLLREPWILENSKERSAAHQLILRLQTALREEARRRGWDIDQTADLARVLRLPGTLNHKNARPKTVKIMEDLSAQRYNPSEFTDCLPDLSGFPLSWSSTPWEHEPNRSFGNQSNGKPADIRSIFKDCSWMRHCFHDRQTLSEPEWFAALSILARSAGSNHDSRQLAHLFSEGYPGYSEVETDRKLRQARSSSGPRTCENIARNLGGWEQHCKTCKHQGKIRSPIVLGRQRQPSQLPPQRVLNRVQEANLFTYSHDIAARRRDQITLGPGPGLNRDGTKTRENLKIDLHPQ